MSTTTKTNMKPLHIQTPLVYSSKFSKEYGRPVYLKLENLQPSGSFKIRGIANLMQRAIARSDGGVSEFVSSSGGNAGLACAHTAHALKVPCTVFVPITTPSFIVQRLKDHYGATVVVHGEVWSEADKAAKAHIHKLTDQGGKPCYVSPFDHPDIWTGCSSIVDEILCQLPPDDAGNAVTPAAIAVSVGGGGLLNGVCEGLEKHKLNQSVTVLAAETTTSSCFATAVRKGRPTPVTITSIATSLGATQVSNRSFEYSKTHKITSVLVDDQEAVAAISQYLNYQQQLVEPACSTVIAACRAVFDEEYRHTIHSGHYDPNHLVQPKIEGTCHYLSCTAGDATPASQRTQTPHTLEHLTNRYYDRLIPKLNEDDIINWARAAPESVKNNTTAPLVIVICGGSLISPQILRFYQQLTQTKHYCRRFDVGYAFIQEVEERNVIVSKHEKTLTEEPEDMGGSD